MKKINILITFVALALSVISCETYDDYDQDRKPVVGFSEVSRNINGVPTGSFKSIDVKLYASDLSSEDRTFNIISVPAILDLTTVPPQIETASENYTFDSTVTIPANSQVGVITVSATNVSLGDTDEYFSLGVEATATVVSGAFTTVRLRK
jgi:hypothetical protein